MSWHVKITLFLIAIFLFSGCASKEPQIIKQTEYQDVYITVSCVDEMPQKPERDRSDPDNQKKGRGEKMSEIKLLPKAKSKIRRCLVLLLGGLFMVVFSVALYRLYGNIFYNEEMKLTALAITQGVVNVLLSPAKIISIFRA